MGKAQKTSKDARPRTATLRGGRSTSWPSHRARANGKAKATTAINDVYEDLPQKVRRGGVGLDLDRSEVRGRRHDSDEIDLADMNTEGKERLRARLLGENKDDEQVESEDDEEVGSDDALGESDKEEFSGSTFKRKMRKEEEDEDEEDEESESSGEFFDVLDIFDGKANVDSDEDTWQKLPQRSQARVLHEEDTILEEEEWGGVDDDSGSEEKDEDESDGSEASDSQMSASDTEDASPEALADLENFLSRLDPAESLKRKPDEEPGSESRTKKRRILSERTEVGEESEFGARGSSMLKLDDLLAPLASTTAFATLKKSTKPLASSSSKTKTLPAPLPQRAQERLDREAAYEQTKQEVDKWSATMKRIKQAEHLSFPLQAEPASRVSNLELAAKFQPSNELESAVDKLLKSAQLRDEDIAQTEALKMAHLSVDEVAARRTELRMMRELAFRADRKAKRIAKIKSKTYRRVRKKQREGLDVPEENEPLDDEAQMKAELDRARERATLRHKTTGKWAQSMKGRDGLGQSQRQAITDMLERGEKLRRRIRGEESGSESEDDGESEDEEMDEESIKRKAFEELEALRTEDSTDPTGIKGKSVFNMKFMQDAAARRAREADAQAKELAQEMLSGLEEPGDSDYGDIHEDTTAAGTSIVQRTGGRISIYPGASTAASSVLKPLGSLASDTSSVTLQSADLLHEVNSTELAHHSTTPTPSIASPVVSISASVNPWLAPPVSSGRARKKNEAIVHKDASALAKSVSKLKKQGTKGDEKERARDDAVLEIDVDKVLTIPDPPINPSTRGQGKEKEKEKRKRSTSSSDGPVDDPNSDVNSEIEEQESLETQGVNAKRIKAFQQRDLVALAFAGDNVVEAFEESKRQEVEADAPREVDTTLPGWGSWGGAGTKKLPPKPHLIKKLPGVDPSSRADFKKAHVIISEKRDKKAAKYLVKDLPHPYTSHAQFEKGMDTPLGTEWNTRVGFQRGTLPRVVKKMGMVIDPLEKLV